MPKKERGHLDYDDRCVIEDGIRDGLSARELAKRLHVNPTTVIREVVANRTVKLPQRKNMPASKRCANYAECEKHEAVCDACTSEGQRSCRRCHAVRCFDHCPDFELRMCGKTRKWPYVCSCRNLDRDRCALPKCSYSARRAEDASAGRRARSRDGISITWEQLDEMVGKVRPLVMQGQSLEAIWMTHGDEFPVGFRTFYGYIDAGIVDIVNLDLPRKMRFRARTRKDARGGDRIDRTGRTYADFLALDDEDRARAVEADTVIGRQEDAQRVLTLHMVAFRFQLYLLLAGGDAALVVAALDAVELYVGSREGFERVFGLVLADRGTEFDDFEGMERSALEPGERRCRVFYCDPMQSVQKPHCERNHEELRRILPKGRCDFDALSPVDVAVACSHVNSYPRKGLGGACPYDLASQAIPKEALDALGVERIPSDEVVLRPTLLAHVMIS